MFEARLGLALGKSIEEVRAMPYPSYRTFELMYLIEPWGWHNAETLASEIMAVLVNINRPKNKKAKPEDFARNMQKGVVDHLIGIASQNKEREKLSEMSIEERRAYQINQIKRDFGAKNGNRRNNSR